MTPDIENQFLEEGPSIPNNTMRATSLHSICTSGEAGIVTPPLDLRIIAAIRDLIY